MQRSFEGLLELDKWFEIISVIVVNCNKHHGLVWNYVLKINSTKLINAMNTEETGMLKICKVSLKLNENVSLACYQAKKLVLLIIMKLRKLVEQGLKHVSSGGSK